MQKVTKVAEQNGWIQVPSTCCSQRHVVLPQVRRTLTSSFLVSRQYGGLPNMTDREFMTFLLFLILVSLCFLVLRTTGIPQHFPNFSEFF